MVELPLAYMNKLANQIILISALLGGFSLTVLASLLDKPSSSKASSQIFKLATVSTTFFLVAIFAMTNIFMRTTEGFPFPVEPNSLNMSRTLGTLAFFLGIMGLIGIVALSGWTKSRRIGRFTTVLGVIFLIVTFVLMT